MNIRLKFLQRNNIVLNFKDEMVNLSDYEIEFPEGKLSEALPEPEKVLIEQVNKVEQIDKFPSLLSGLKALETNTRFIPKKYHKIPLKKEANIVCKFLNIPTKLIPKLEKEIERLLKQGVKVNLKHPKIKDLYVC